MGVSQTLGKLRHRASYWKRNVRDQNRYGEQGCRKHSSGVVK